MRGAAEPLSQDSPRPSDFGGHLRAPEVPESRSRKPKAAVSGALAKPFALFAVPKPQNTRSQRHCRSGSYLRRSIGETGRNPCKSALYGRSRGRCGTTVHAAQQTGSLSSPPCPVGRASGGKQKGDRLSSTARASAHRSDRRRSCRRLRQRVCGGVQQRELGDEFRFDPTQSHIEHRVAGLRARRGA